MTSLFFVFPDKYEKNDNEINGANKNIIILNNTEISLDSEMIFTYNDNNEKYHRTKYLQNINRHRLK